MSDTRDRPSASAPGRPRASAAALWDFDGTLADTEPLWIEAEFELIGQLGGQWSIEHADQLVGNSLLDSGAYILNTIGRHDLTPAWVVDQLLSYVVRPASADGPMPWRPGALELLESFGAAGVPCALVSASYRVLLDAALARLPDGHLPGLGRRRRGDAGQAASRAVRAGLPGARGRRPALRGVRGLGDRRPVRQRRRGPGHRRAEPGATSRRRRGGRTSRRWPSWTPTGWPPCWSGPMPRLDRTPAASRHGRSRSLLLLGCRAARPGTRRRRPTTPGGHAAAVHRAHHRPDPGRATRPR